MYLMRGCSIEGVHEDDLRGAGIAEHVLDVIRIKHGHQRVYACHFGHVHSSGAGLASRGDVNTGPRGRGIWLLDLGVGGMG